MKRIKAVIDGMVQGVGYRYFTLHHAEKLGLTGSVRNRWRGDVEVIAEGDEAMLKEFISILKQGPRYSHVEDVKVTWETASGKFNSFIIER